MRKQYDAKGKKLIGVHYGNRDYQVGQKVWVNTLRYNETGERITDRWSGVHGYRERLQAYGVVRTLSLRGENLWFVVSIFDDGVCRDLVVLVPVYDVTPAVEHEAHVADVLAAQAREDAERKEKRLAEIAREGRVNWLRAELNDFSLRHGVSFGVDRTGHSIVIDAKHAHRLLRLCNAYIPPGNLPVEEDFDAGSRFV